jgi:hypothetical protein
VHHQLLKRKGLSEVIVRTGLQAGDAVRWVALCREDQHRGRVGAAADRSHVEPISVGQAEMEHDDIPPPGFKRNHSLVDAGDEIDRKNLSASLRCSSPTKHACRRPAANAPALHIAPRLQASDRHPGIQVRAGRAQRSARFGFGRSEQFTRSMRMCGSRSTGAMH